MMEKHVNCEENLHVTTVSELSDCAITGNLPTHLVEPPRPPPKGDKNRKKEPPKRMKQELVVYHGEAREMCRKR